jgi:hypothetical protein
MDFNRIMQQTKSRLIHVVSNEQSALPPLLRSDEAQPEDEEEGLDDKMEGLGREEGATQAFGSPVKHASSASATYLSSPCVSLSSSPATSCKEGGKGHLHDYLSQPLPPPRAFEPVPAPQREEVIRDKHDVHMHVGGGGSLSHRRKSSTGGH